MKAVWNQVVIAESDDTVVVEGNHYFPLSSVKSECLAPSSHTTVCGWKGLANYYDVVVNGQTNANAAWYYAEPKPRAAEIKDRVAFWRGVTVSA
ncbi:MAG: DUF427 domain-containing protein [Pseudomonadota bacterium]|nr:DUF427 domain-containing protein [Pseudomonadota bacterium]